jgi:hypothetical protein
MLNTPLFVEYIQWTKKSKLTYKYLESLFFMLFFELQDISTNQKLKKNTKQRLVKLKEMIAITLVKGEYHNIIHYILGKNDELNSSKMSYKRHRNDHYELDNSQDVIAPDFDYKLGYADACSQFKPFMHLNYDLLRK